jgi:hypothetical protein
MGLKGRKFAFHQQVCLERTSSELGKGKEPQGHGNPAIEEHGDAKVRRFLSPWMNVVIGKG